MINALILALHPSKVPPILLDKQFSDFTPDITPIILAAHTNNYEIIKLLVQKGVSMPQPHEVGELVCVCVLTINCVYVLRRRTASRPWISRPASTVKQREHCSDCWESRIIYVQCLTNVLDQQNM